MQKFTFSEDNHKVAQSIISKYPEDQRFSALMPLLTLIQKQNGGYLTDNCILYLSEYLNVPPMSVYEVANFYSMYTLQTVGKYLIQMCKSVVCKIQGVDDLYKYCKEITGTQTGYVSDDGLFSVKKVECLGACVNALAIKINDTFVENVTKESLANIVNDLKEGKPLKEAFNVKQPSSLANMEGYNAGKSK